MPVPTVSGRHAQLKVGESSLLSHAVDFQFVLFLKALHLPTLQKAQRSKSQTWAAPMGLL